MKQKVGLSSLLRLFLLALVMGVGLVPASLAQEDPEDRSKKQVAFGITVARQGLWEEAIYRWVQAVELDPENASARNNLGVAYEQAGKFELANETYERALEIASDNMYIRQNYELFREAYERKKRKDRQGEN